MPGYKFSEQPELKAIILYIIDSFGKPAAGGFVTDIFMTHEFVDYFTMQTYLDNLVSTGLVEVFEEDNTRKYILTDIGKEAVSLYKDKIPNTVRKKILRSIKAYRKEVEEALNVSAEYKPYNELEHMAVLSISEGGSPLLHMEVNCGSKKMAMDVCHAFKRNPQKYYEKILNVITCDD